MPYAIAVTPVVLAHAVIWLPLVIAIPVLSKTEFAGIVAPYSKKSVVAAVPPLAVTANLTVTAVAFLLQIETVTTAKFVAAHVYNDVSVVAAKSRGVPKRPDAMLFLHYRIIFINSLVTHSIKER
jgi:hypothetical protein